MNTQQNKFSNFLTGLMGTEKKESSDLTERFAKYSFYWPLFISSTILFLGLGYLYLHVTKPIYEINATLLIDDTKKKPDDQSVLHEIDLDNSTKIIDNEIQVLKSMLLISRVVDDLQLWAIYQKENFLVNDNLYNSSPISFKLLKSSGPLNGQSFDIVIKDEKTFYLKKSNGQLEEFPFQKALKNDFGIWELNVNKNISKYRGATIKIKLLDPEKLALQYQDLIKTNLLNKVTTAVQLNVNDNIPQRGKDILDRLIFEYNVANTAQKNKETEKTLDFIDQRLSSLTGELTGAEKNVEGFKSSKGITDISSQAQLSLESMQSNDARLNDVNVQLSVIDGIEDYVNSSKGSGNSPSMLGISDQNLIDLVTKLSQLQLEKDQLTATTPLNNPIFDPINMQIVTTKSAIKDNIKNIKLSLLSTRKQLASYNSHFESSIKNIPEQERQFISIKRQETIKENLYIYLLQKREEVSLSYASAVANNRIVDNAYKGALIGPKRSYIYLAALFIGLGLPWGFISVKNSLKNLITSRKEIEDNIEIPVIGELFFNKTGKQIIIDENVSIISEQFSTLITTLDSLNSQNDLGRVTLVTSSVSKEGKSFVSANLSAALSSFGRKSILLELDLRRPTVSKLFNLTKEHPGIDDLLTGKATIEEIIQTSELAPDLDIIACKPVTSNQLKLLKKPQLGELILYLRKNYDEIIIDTPPFHLVSDAIIISAFADVILYVIRQGLTQKSELNFIKDLYKIQKMPQTGIIFNCIQKEKYGYGYHYDKSYYK